MSEIIPDNTEDKQPQESSQEHPSEGEKWAGLDSAEERIERHAKERQQQEQGVGGEVEDAAPEKPGTWSGLETAEERVERFAREREPRDASADSETENTLEEPETKPGSETTGEHSEQPAQEQASIITEQVVESPAEKVVRDENEALTSHRLHEAKPDIVANKKESLKERVAYQQAEKYGIDQSSGSSQVTRNFTSTAINSVGSILGARLAWEAPKLAIDYFRKKEQRSSLDEATMELLNEARKSKQKPETETPDGVVAENEPAQEATEKRSTEVRERITGLETRLKEARMKPDEKKALRTELAHILKEYRHSEKELGNMRDEQLGALLGSYLNNKAQAWLVAKEAVNTLSVAVAAPALRLLGYTAFSAAERTQKAVESYNREHLRAKDATAGGKFTAVYQSMKKAFSETWRGLDVLSPDERSGTKRALELTSSLGTVFRAAGLAEFEYALQTGSITPQDGFEKLRDAVEEGRVGAAFGQAGENWLGNAKRLLHMDGIVEREPKVTQPTPGGKTAWEALAERHQENAGRTAQETGATDFIKKAFGEGALAKEALLGGVTREELGLAEKALALGLHPDDFSSYAHSPAELSKMIDVVEKLSLGENTPDVLKTLLDHPETIDKLDDTLTRELLALPNINEEHVERILTADTITSVGKGESVSEALGLRLAPDAQITVVNPDGTVLENFDANLVHAGDTVVHNTDGNITIYKTSEITVRPEQSLQGIYNSIEKDLNDSGIPKELQRALNHGENTWENRISRAEAGEIKRVWSGLEKDVNSLSAEDRRAFLGTLQKGMSSDEITALLHERQNAAEAVARIYTPEEIAQVRPPGDVAWPPTDNKTPAERISPDAWSEQVKGGGQFTLDAETKPISASQWEVNLPAEKITEAPPPENLPETEPIPETTMEHAEDEPILEQAMRPESALFKYEDGKEGNFTGKFDHDNNGNVIRFLPVGSPVEGGDVLLQNLVLKSDWGKTISETMGDKASSTIKDIENDALALGIKKRILETMWGIGKGGTEEYTFLKNEIATNVTQFEKKYGDIFK